jgi:hypothetical protein
VRELVEGIRDLFAAFGDQLQGYREWNDFLSVNTIIPEIQAGMAKPV